MRNAYANIALSRGDWKLMCETVSHAVKEFDASGAWPDDIDDAPRMDETDKAAWELRKQMATIAEQRNVLEDALFALWSDPTSSSACDEAARVLAVGPYDPAYDLGAE